MFRFRRESLYCLYGLVCEPWSPKFSLCRQCINITKLFIYSHNSFQILPHFVCWCYNNKSVILLKIYPLPKRTVTLYFTGYSSRKHQAEHVELLCLLKYVNYSCILDFIPHTTQASSSMLFRENKADNRSLLNYKLWMQCLCWLSFCIPGVKETLQFIAEVC